MEHVFSSFYDQNWFRFQLSLPKWCKNVFDCCEEPTIFTNEQAFFVVLTKKCLKSDKITEKDLEETKMWDKLAECEIDIKKRGIKKGCLTLPLLPRKTKNLKLPLPV